MDTHEGNLSLANCTHIMGVSGGNTVNYNPDRGCDVLLCEGTEIYIVPVLGKWSVHSTLCASPDLAYAQMPGGYTFLGGSGLMLPAYAGEAGEGDARRLAEGWKILQELADRTKPWIVQANTMRALRTPPPSSSLTRKPPFTNPEWEPVVQAMDRAIPSTHPGQPFPEFDDIEAHKPLRIALVRAVYANVSTKQALEDGCGIIDGLLRPCNRDTWQRDRRCMNLLDGEQGCPAGQHLVEESAAPRRALQCATCPGGTFQPGRSVNASCLICPLGKFSYDRGATR